MRFTLRRLAHVPLCTLRQIVLAQSHIFASIFHRSLQMNNWTKGKIVEKWFYSKSRVLMGLTVSDFSKGLY